MSLDSDTTNEFNTANKKSKTNSKDVLDIRVM